VTWAAVPDADLSTNGYIVEMLLNNNWVVVYDGQTNSNTLTRTQFGLTTAQEYKFRVYSVDFNGVSDASTVLSAYACGLPTGLAAPTLKSSSQTNIEVDWEAPAYDGGCPIFDYEV
jgi:hypothetical protein